MVGRFGSDEGLRFPVVVVDEVADGVLQWQRAAMNAAPDLFFGEFGEPAFDQLKKPLPVLMVSCTVTPTVGNPLLVVPDKVVDPIRRG